MIIKVITTSRPDAVEFLPLITAPANYKAPDAIQRYIEETTQRQIAKAAFNPNTCQIVEIGILDMGEKLFFSHSDEAELLRQFWQSVSGIDTFVGYGILHFDLPVILYRSAALGIKPSRPYRLTSRNTDGVYDLCHILYSGQIDEMQKLVSVAKQFDLYSAATLRETLDAHETMGAHDEISRGRFVSTWLDVCHELFGKMEGVYL